MGTRAAGECFHSFFVLSQTFTPRGGGGGGEGVLRYISDGDVRSPFLGLKFCSDFFWVRDFGKDIFGG